MELIKSLNDFFLALLIGLILRYVAVAHHILAVVGQHSVDLIIQHRIMALSLNRAYCTGAVGIQILGIELIQLDDCLLYTSRCV